MEEALMKGYSVYHSIKQLKEQGFKKAAVARRLGINRRTVDRYWDMAVDDYQELHKKVKRRQSLDEYKDAILGWIHDHPDISAAQICDWLKENYDQAFSGRTVSRYVKELRETNNLRKHPNARTYEAVPEFPMGMQVQADFGEKYLSTATGAWVKVYAAAFLLSRSRYMYAEFQTRPFTASDLVAACCRCFNYFGGVPREMVFDQDSIVCVSENAGDIVYTYEFEKFRQQCKLSVYMCRGADPESKGKIESTIKYIKGNFLANRIFIDEQTLNASCLRWLERTANARVHGTTKLIPAEVFREERDALLPLGHDMSAPDTRIFRTVRKDNTIVYTSNRYTVPYNTYNKYKEVLIRDDGGTLYIQTPDGEPLCEHRICEGRGILVRNTDHLRDKTSAVDRLQCDLDERLDHKAADFLSAIRSEKRRYARDQFRIIGTLLDKYGLMQCLDAIDFCTKCRLYSANTMKDYLEHLEHQNTQPVPLIDIHRIQLDDPRYHIHTQKRPLEVYTKVGDRS